MEENTILLKIREMVYSFLSSSFLYPPNSDQVKTILEQQLFEEFPLEINTNDFTQGLALLQSWAKDSENRQLDEILTDLQRDYTSLFIGPGHLPAPPWESVYLTEEKLTFGEPTLKVREFYLRHGLAYHKKNSEPDDHFGLEMEFMSKLIAKQRQELENGQNDKEIQLEKEQILFLQDHILKWLNQFTHDVFRHSNTDFFKGLSLFARGFITWDHEYLQQ